MKAGFKISDATLNSLIAELEVQFVSFSEYLVSCGCRVSVRECETPSLYYVMEGSGVMHFPKTPSITVEPHTLVIVPPNCSFSLETCEQNAREEVVLADDFNPTARPTSVRTFTVGNGSPKTIIFCVFLRTLYCTSLGLFETLSDPVAEVFRADDRLDMKFKSVMVELASQDVGAGAMTAALLKEIIVTLFRRSFSSLTSWAGRVSLLSDPQVALAFANMVVQPGKAHTIHTLATGACL